MLASVARSPVLGAVFHSLNTLQIHKTGGPFNTIHLLKGQKKGRDFSDRGLHKPGRLPNRTRQSWNFYNVDSLLSVCIPIVSLI